MLTGVVADSPRYKWWVFGAVGLGSFTGVMTFGSVNVALPTIADHFGSDLPTIQWVVIAQTLTISALLLPMGRLSDLVGRKRVYLTGLLFLIGASVFAAISPNVALLILSRIAQGVGAAMTQGTAMAMITSVFPDEERGKGIGTHMSVIGAGGMAGPAVGGLLVSAFGWRSVFLINLPLAAIALLGALLLLDARLFRREKRGARFDWPGAALSTAALVTFLMLMTNGNSLGWMSPVVVLGALLFVGLVTGFLLWESRAPQPMLDLGLFRSRVFSLGVLAAFMSYLSVGSVRFLMPFYLQGVLGFPASQVGLIMLPTAVTMTITGPIAGRLSDRFGYRFFNVLGLVIAAVGVFVISRVSESTPLAVIIAALVIQSAGSGLFSSPNSASIFSASSSVRHGIVSALLSLVRNSANVTSIALGTTVVAATMTAMGFTPDLGGVPSARESAAGAAFVNGMNFLYTGTGCLLLLGAVASFFKGGDFPPVGRTRNRQPVGRVRAG